MDRIYKSFGYAIRGIILLIRTEKNFRIHSILFILAVITGFILQITRTEWLIVLLNSTLVFSLEAVNSSIEKLCDFHTKEQHPEIAKIKDISAGAVLIAALFALITGIIIFGSYIFHIFANH